MAMRQFRYVVVVSTLRVPRSNATSPRFARGQQIPKLMEELVSD
jgi:hypothetical protein